MKGAVSMIHYFVGPSTNSKYFTSRDVKSVSWRTKTGPGHNDTPRGCGGYIFKSLLYLLRYPRYVSPYFFEFRNFENVN